MRAVLLPTAAMFGFFRELWDLFKKPQYRSILVWVIILLRVGMIFYSPGVVESKSLLKPK